MTSNKGRKPGDDWQAVTQAEPCPVCKHPDWCRVSPDGKWALCRREAHGCQDVTKYSDGGEAYRHLLRDDPPQRPSSNGHHAGPKPTGNSKPAPVLADIDTRDRVYRMLLAELQLSPEHRDALRARGLTDEAIDAGGYRTLPADSHAMAANLWRALGGTEGVAPTIPGLYWDGKHRRACIAAALGLLVPVRDTQDRIQALKVRRDATDADSRYLYVSSTNHDGPGPGSPAHVPAGIVGPCLTVRITEGELKADVATRLSGVPTISFPGVSSWRTVLAVLQELRARTVRVAFDADAAGNPNVARPLRECCRELAALGYVIELERWELTAGKGIDDLLQAGGTPEVLNGPDALRAVDDIAKAAGVQDAAQAAAGSNAKEKPEHKPAPWVPFPVDVLPAAVAEFTQAAADALGCDAAYVALPLLAMLAACVGNARRVRLKRDWAEPCILWCVTIGRSGTMKSPAWELAVRPLQHRQTKAFREHREAMERYELDKALWDADRDRWKREGRKKGEPPPTAPAVPIAARYVASDVTVEALAVLLQDNPRGLLLSRDELSGWLSSFDAYKGVRGADVPNWLSMHRAGSLTTDRKTGRPVIHIPRAAVSIAGSVQPSILAKALGGRYDGEEGSGEHFANGLAARLLMANPPPRPKRWRDDDIPDAVSDRLERVVAELLTLDIPDDDYGEPTPVDVALQPPAKRRFIRFYNAHADEQLELSDDLAAAWSKLEGYAARFALLLHLVRQADGDRTASDAVDLQDMEAGITLSRWFADEAARIYAELGGDADTADAAKAREQGRLIEWIRGRGGQVTPRELAASGPRQLRGSVDEAEQRLQELADVGKGELFTPPHDGPGRPHGVVFRLLDTLETETKPQYSQGKRNFVSVSTTEQAGNATAGGDDEWGEI